MTRRGRQAHCLSKRIQSVASIHACACADSAAGDQAVGPFCWHLRWAELVLTRGPASPAREQLAALIQSTSLDFAVLQGAHLLEVCNEWVVEAALMHDLSLHISLVVPDAVTWLQPNSRCQWCCLQVHSGMSRVLLLEARRQ